MVAVVKRFAEDTPLHGGIFVVVHGDVFLYRPTERAVVDDNVGSILNIERRFVALVAVAHAETQVADDIVVAREVDASSRDADTVARCRLSGKGDVAAVYFEHLFEVDTTRSAEYDSDRVVPLGLQSGSQAALDGRFARSVIFGIRNENDTSAASAGGEASPAFGSRECNGAVFFGHRSRRQCEQCGTCHDDKLVHDS